MKFIDLQQWPAACPDSETENLIFDKDENYAQKKTANTLAQKIESHATIQLEPPIRGALLVFNCLLRPILVSSRVGDYAQNEKY